MFDFLRDNEQTGCGTDNGTYSNALAEVVSSKVDEEV